MVATALFAAAGAGASTRDEDALAQKYSPVVRLVEQPVECGPGEPYIPLDVDLLFGQPTVALRGPWNTTDLVKIGPSAQDMVNRFEYHLDYPGSALSPGCDYENWQRHLLAGGGSPTVYAHVATEPAHPGKLALQYWFFYVFNDFNNTHEGDWEMVQLDFDATDAAEALNTEPTAIGYSSHEGAERADWGEDKLELVDGTHPVVYPAAGSHANKFGSALYLGSSADAGVGCDDTLGPHDEVRPVVKTIPSDPAVAAKAYPWIAFDGRWGELQKAFYNGPTGPNLKTQWTEPITWSDGWRDRSYAVPAAGLFGTSTTDFFCSAVAKGSKGLIQLLRNPAATLLVLAAILGLAAFAIARATWTPVAPLRIARRRAWGQILSASARMYVKRPGLLLGLGVLLIPISVVITLVQWILLGGLDVLGSVSGELAGIWAFLSVVLGTMLALLGLGLVQAATACALTQIDAGREVGPVHAFRLALRNVGPLVRGLTLAVAVGVALVATGLLIPVAVWLAVRWALLAQAAELEDGGTLRGLCALRRSAELVRGRWLRVASLVGLSAAIALAAGPLLGALLILATSAPLALLNVVAGVVYALAMPFVALVTAYVYFDARVREELEPDDGATELPAEIELSAG